MLLAVDIGNTNFTLGVHDGNAWRRQWRWRTVHDRTVDELGVLLVTLLRHAELLPEVERVIVSSVVPAVTPSFLVAVEEYMAQACLVVDPSANTGVDIRTDNPHEVGADRIVNAAAAHALFPGPSIVVDMGTATTFDVIAADGALLGVAIAPGLRLAADALAQGAAQLSHVPLAAPAHAIGRNTIAAVQSGLIFGYAGLVESMINRILAEHPDNAQRVTVIGTGGHIGLVADHVSRLDHLDPWLTLTGLKVLADRMPD